MKNLEQYIRDHRDEFDADEPDEGHFAAFRDRLAFEPQAAHAPFRSTAMLRVAAVVLLMITVSVAVFEFGARYIGNTLSARSEEKELPDEVREAMQYYDNRASAGIAEIRQLAAGHSGIGADGKEALREIGSLDASTAELKLALADDPGNEKITDAILRNQQMKDAILTHVITRLSQAVK